MDPIIKWMNTVFDKNLPVSRHHTEIDEWNETWEITFRPSFCRVNLDGWNDISHVWNFTRVPNSHSRVKQISPVTRHPSLVTRLCVSTAIIFSLISQINEP